MPIFTIILILGCVKFSNFEGCKYSAPIRYNGHNVVLEIDEDYLEIYDGSVSVSEHKLSDKRFNLNKICHRVNHH
ncbi:Mu transposase domain-containing protein [Lactococcus allomyrinae]|uniref:Transposase for insertion sequence element IS21-like C-terminal domain-containing protein n=1 Tax=Lactococcus allomyrinae TaxID=2419773 RepID=A0A387BG53_9LACT|nr:hypothetical protein D7I46_04410 [Lactococcus allomyrinae]